MKDNLDDLEGIDLTGEENFDSVFGRLEDTDGWDLLESKTNFGFGNFSGCGLSGKEKCRVLKQVRADIAAEYNIPGFEFKECDFDGTCTGTCPACEDELKKLTFAVEHANMNKKPKRNIFSRLIKPDPAMKQGLVLPPKNWKPASLIIEERSNQALMLEQHKSGVYREPMIMMGMPAPPSFESIKSTEDFPDMLEGDVKMPWDPLDDPDICGGLTEGPDMDDLDELFTPDELESLGRGENEES